MSLYTGYTSNLCLADGASDWFDIRVGVIQGSTRSLLLFVLVLEEIPEEIPRGGVWKTLNTDDLVLARGERQKVEVMLVKWSRAMECKGLAKQSLWSIESLWKYPFSWANIPVQKR